MTDEIKWGKKSFEPPYILDCVDSIGHLCEIGFPRGEKGYIFLHDVGGVSVENYRMVVQGIRGLDSKRFVSAKKINAELTTDIYSTGEKLAGKRIFAFPISHFIKGEQFDGLKFVDFVNSFSEITSTPKKKEPLQFS